MTFSAIFIGLFPEFVVGLFTKDKELIAICVPIVYILVCFQVFDGLQVALSGIYKGIKKTKIVLWANFIAYWIVSIPLGFTLAFKFKYGLAGFWWGLVSSSILLCTIMLIMLKKYLKPLIKVWKKFDEINFEEFNIDNGNENDLYVNPNFFCDVDNKDNKENKVNHIEQSPETNNQNVIEDNFMPPLRSPKKKTRRNATHRLVVNKYESKPNNNNNNNNQKRYFNPNNYDFQIIDINGQVDDKELSEDSIDSEAECIEVTENSKSEKQRLVFFEDYLRDKDKRRLTKIDPLQIGPDPTFLENRERLIELNKLSYKNIIDIVKDTTSLLPNYKLNLDPQAFANEINEIEKFAMDNKSVNSKDGGKDKIFIYSNDSSNGDNNNIKESKRFETIHNSIIFLRKVFHTS